MRIRAKRLEADSALQNRYTAAVLFTHHALLAFVVAIFVNGCAAAQPHLWPPVAGEPSYPVYVSLDTWHGMIGFPTGRDSPVLDPEQKEFPAELSTRQSDAAFEEWGYAEYKWYVEGEQGITGILRALFWPTAGTVEIARCDRLWASRTPQPPADLFKFNLSEEGWRRIRSHLRSTLADNDPIKIVDSSAFYPSKRAYHLFHNSHHYLADALKEAGIPISPFWAINPTMLAMQLRRAQRLAEELMTAKGGEVERLPEEEFQESTRIVDERLDFHSARASVPDSYFLQSIGNSETSRRAFLSGWLVTAKGYGKPVEIPVRKASQSRCKGEVT